MTLAKLLNAPAYIIIIRAVHERGESQRMAFEVLKARGLWLSDEQKAMAAASIDGGPIGEALQ
jgi:hypothetical protein